MRPHLLPLLSLLLLAQAPSALALTSPVTSTPGISINLVPPSSSSSPAVPDQSLLSWNLDIAQKCYQQKDYACSIARYQV